MKEGSSIAVVGAGVAGLTAAYLLQKKYRVTLFERNDYIGGHTHTIVLQNGPDAGTPVDTGFIVMNDRNYPLLTKLFARLGVALRNSDMSFSYYDEHTGLQYSGSDLNGLFAQRRNLLRPSFLLMVRDILRFYRNAREDLAQGRLQGLSLGEYLRRGRYGALFVRHHIVPMGAAIWSTPCDRMMEFPAASFLHFLENHGLLSVGGRPQWKTVVGGSHAYVHKMLATFTGDVRRATPVTAVTRANDRVTLVCRDGELGAFDGVIIAAHADEALAMLSDPTDAERRALGAWEYARNHTVLHSDHRAMPPQKRAWASWNYTRERAAPENGPATLTYDMNRLQGLETRRRYFVSLNRLARPPADAVIGAFDYDHPTFTEASMASQAALPGLNGSRRTWFCGSYFGYGFHEDAVRSAVRLAQGFGLDL